MMVKRELFVIKESETTQIIMSGMILGEFDVQHLMRMYIQGA